MINYIDLIHYFRSYLYNRVYSDNNFISAVDNIIRSNNFVNNVVWTTHPFTVYVYVTPSIDDPEPMNYKFAIDNIIGIALEHAIIQKETDLKEESSKILLYRNLGEANSDTLYDCLVNNIYRVFNSCILPTGQQNQYQVILTL